MEAFDDASDFGSDDDGKRVGVGRRGGADESCGVAHDLADDEGFGFGIAECSDVFGYAVGCDGHDRCRDRGGHGRGEFCRLLCDVFDLVEQRTGERGGRAEPEKE